VEEQAWTGELPLETARTFKTDRVSITRHWNGKTNTGVLNLRWKAQRALSLSASR